MIRHIVKDIDRNMTSGQCLFIVMIDGTAGTWTRVEISPYSKPTKFTSVRSELGVTVCN